MEQPVQPPQDDAAPELGGLVSTPASTLVGRGALLAQTVGLLTDPTVRLLTLTGPGGVGKTTLARAAAALVAEAFPDGVDSVELAAERDPARLLPAILQALSLEPPEEEPPLTTLARGLIGRRLVLLDNLEQIAAGAPVLADLLAACPGLTILATSRTPLRVSGEHQLPVPPLVLPGEAVLPAEVAASPAVELFARRARAANAAFALTPANAAAVAEVCRRLDGLPLALELGAARLRLLSSEALLARLDARLDLLADGLVDRPERHRTIRAAVAWSVEILDPDARWVFALLSAFAGGCTLDDLVAVVTAAAGYGGRTVDDVPATVRALLDGALLQETTGRGGVPRLAMLESVRDVALEMLAATGAAGVVRRAHAERFRDVAERDGPGLRSDHYTQSRISDAFNDDLPNLRAALAWFADRSDAIGGLRLVAGLDWFWMVSRPVMAEGIDWADRFLALATPDALIPRRLFGEIHRIKALLGDWLGRIDDTERDAGVAIAALAETSSHASLVETLLLAASVAFDRADLHLARDRYGHLLALADRHAGALGDTAALRFIVGKANTNLALVLALLEQSAEALERVDAAVEHFGRIGGPEAWMRGAQHARALAHLAGGDHAAAGDALLDAVLRSRPNPTDLQAGDHLGLILPAVGLLARRRGEQALAVRLIAAGDAIVRERTPLRPPLQLQIDAEVAALRATLGDARFGVEWAAGAATTEAERLDMAETFLRSLVAPTFTGKLPELTRRELAVLRLLLDGATDKQIAERLFISPRTASYHVSGLLKKLGQPSRTAAAAYAAAHGLRP